MDNSIDIKVDDSTVGVALLVSNDYASLLGRTKLVGVHEDADKLEEQFKKFGYVVYKRKNVSYVEFSEHCGEMSHFNYPETCKRLVVYFSGHGNEGILEMQDGEIVDIEDIVRLFEPRFGSKLTNANTGVMARMFFFDSCRGAKHFPVAYKKLTYGNNPQNKFQLSKVSIQGNTLIAYACTQKYVAYPGTTGSRWTNCLVEALENSKEADSLQTVLTMANGLMSRIFDGDCVQTPTFYSSLKEDVFLKKEAFDRIKKCNAPRSLSAKNVTDTAVTLEWMKPDMPNGNITEYQLECSPEVAHLRKHHSLTGEMSGLFPDTKYRFRVAAITEEGGRGPFSDIVYYNTAKTKHPPSKVKAGTDEPQSADFSQYKVESLWSLKEIYDMVCGRKTISTVANEELLKEVVLLVLTVSIHEYYSVLCYLEPLTGHADIYKYTQYDIDGPQPQFADYLIGKYGAIPTAVRQIAPGSAFDGATTAPNLAFRCFKSLNAIIGVGVAIGVENRTKFFDVIVANEVRNYDQAKLCEDGPKNRGKAIPASKLLSSIFRRPIKWPEDEIKERLDECNVPEPEIKLGVILSGPDRIADTQTKNEIIQNFAPEAIGFEMEAAYLFRAAINTPIHMTIVKAVYDFGDGRRTSVHFRPTAALLAANCLKRYFDDPQVLKTLQTEPDSPQSSSYVPLPKRMRYAHSSGTATVSAATAVSDNSLDSKPNLLELLPYFERVADWDKICPYLLDDNDGQMTRKIEKNNKDVDGMRKEMLDEFLKKSNATWSNVVSAMRAGRYNNLADEIEKDLKG